jgi:NAD(P)-dependent dehydrogenase (short-subunit alcohol dehydrogenase family)
MSENDSSRCVLITGASGNLGRAVAAAFAARGARLVLLAAHAESLARAFGGDDASRMLLACDLRQRDQVEAAVAAAIERHGRIDALCNLAGGFRMGEAVHETADETWLEMADLNVRSLVNACRAVVPRMLAAGGGSIVNIASLSAQHGAPRMGAYSAAKAAVLRLTESMSAELRDGGINVNCVLPATLDTPQNRAAMPDADPARWVAPADLAEVIVFLASPAARAVHGAALPVTGLG